MKNKRLLQCCSFCFGVLLLTTSIMAQNIAPYVDNSGRFKVFDNGETHELEEEEVSEVQVGGDYLIYKDVNGFTKRYMNGESTVIAETTDVDFYPTQYLMAIGEGLKGEVLKVNFGGEEELLSLDMDEGRFAVGDSVLAFRDNFGDLSIFYNGEIYEMGEDRGFRVGTNSVVFLDTSEVMYIFHEGVTSKIYDTAPQNVYQPAFYPKMRLGDDKDFPNAASSKNSKMLQEAKVTSLMPNRIFRAENEMLVGRDRGYNAKVWHYKNDTQTASVGLPKKTRKCQMGKGVTCLYAVLYYVGDNFVLFLNKDEMMVYEEGELQQATTFRPRFYRGGKKMVVFLSGDRLMMYWEGEVTELSPRFPKFQAFVENTLTYVDDLGYFHVFDKGKKILLETSQPEYVAVSDGVVGYVDSDGYLNAYYEGKKIDVSKEIVKNFRLEGRVIIYTIRNNKVKIFHGGKHYSG